MPRKRRILPLITARGMADADLSPDQQLTQSWERSRGFAPVCVYAYGQNSRAIRFYEAAGFRLDGRARLDADDGTGVTEVRLARGAA